MNILIVTQYFWPENFRINDLAESLVQRGHQVTVLTGKPNYPSGNFFPGYGIFKKNREKYGEIDVIRAPLVSRGKNNKIRLALNYLSFAFFASVIGLIKCKKPDVIFVFEPSPITVGIPAIFYKKLRKVPILFWVQDLWPESVVAVGAIHSKNKLKWLEKLVNTIYKNCDYILTTSKGYFDSIKKFSGTEKKLRYFPQMVEALYQPLDNAANTEEAKLLPNGFRVIFSGNLGIAQDMETILQAALLLKEHKEIKWIFLGDGSKRTWLESQINENNLSETVFWLGQHPVVTMPRFFASADALLVTLKKDPVFSLTIPGKIQSYLACAKPIVAAMDGEGQQIINEAQAGFSANSGDAVGLAEQVLKMYRLNPAERHQLGQNGFDYFKQHFQRDVLLQRLENWMDELREHYKK
jgi:colanic acid biosynthesis glycosyl transferase WcaI